jgi:hypothetical protein
MGEVVAKTYARLTKEVYEDLERKLPAPSVQRDTTDLQAGFQLGIQHVLKMLREGYVIGK